MALPQITFVETHPTHDTGVRTWNYYTFPVRLPSWHCVKSPWSESDSDCLFSCVKNLLFLPPCFADFSSSNWVVRKRSGRLPPVTTDLTGFLYSKKMQNSLIHLIFSVWWFFFLPLSIVYIFLAFLQLLTIVKMFILNGQ